MRITDPLGYTTTHTYDAQDNRISSTDRLGATTCFAYDGRKNLIRLTDALGNITSYAYDVRGLLTVLTDANGHARAFAYDAQGNLIRFTDALGHASTHTYNLLGRRLSQTDALGHSTQNVYDLAGRLLRHTDPLGNVTSYTYNRDGLPPSVTDARGYTTRYGYDAQFNLSVVTDTLGNTTHYDYDLNGRLAALTDANGHATRYGRDALGRIVQITDPLSRTVRLAYNANDWLVSRTKADGHIIRYEYDALGRLTRTAYPDGSATTYTYDAEGQTVNTRNGTWQAQYTRDALGRLLGTELAEEGVRLAYRYDAADRLTSATDALISYTVSYSYNEDNSVNEIRHPSGVRARYTHDAARRSTRLEHRDGANQALAVLDYVYDAVGNPTRQTRSASGATLAITYDYDGLDRLIRESHPRYAVEYAYDAVGNRTRMVSPLGVVTYTYDVADQLLSAGACTFSYDANGSQTARRDARGIYTLTYDDRNHLTGIVAPGNVRTTFRYDPAGWRIAVQGNAGNQRTIYDGGRPIFAGAEGFGQGQAYLWGAGLLAVGRPLGAGDGKLAVGYLGDTLGNVTSLADGEGEMRAAYRYDPFGRLQAATRGVQGSFLFQGVLGARTEPALSDVYLLGLRYYDASLGRFLTWDPLPGQHTRPQTLNRYAYALNNPLRYLDPLGLSPNQGTTMTDEEIMHLFLRNPEVLNAPLIQQAYQDWMEGLAVCRREKQFDQM